MKVIAVLNQKGGSGKTTIATQLARGLQLQGHSVLLVDSDQQGSARDWRAVDEDNPVPVIGLDRPTLDKDLKVENGGNVEAAKLVGKSVAEKAKKAEIKTVVFDRGGYLYHGRVQALADAARENGLEF